MVTTVLTFQLEKQWFGIDITFVKEINRNVEYTTVPGAAPYIVGLLNLRGQVVTLLDLEQLLAGRRQSLMEFPTKATCIILKPFQPDPQYSGFLITRTGDVLEIEQEQWELSPANLSCAEEKFLHGILKLEHQLLPVIKVEAVIDSI